MTAAESSQRLNPEQIEAVQHGDGPLLVLAGAGTGKTSTLTARLAALLQRDGVRPWEVLAVTFTNKAANEMRQRVMDQLEGVGETPRWIGTFHSISSRMLRRHAKLAGLDDGYSILDADASAAIVNEVAQSLNIDTKRWSKGHLSSIVARWKDRALAPDAVPSEEAQWAADGKGGRLYRDYCQRLKELNAADFGDLILHMVRILQQNDDVAAIYRRQFRHVLVDEYQDTNVAQYMWLRLLTGDNQNVCCVGDEDQSIYGWRGAQIDHILRFERDFPNATIVRLEENYRSTGHILGAASALIAHNTGRLGKTLRTSVGDGLPVRVGGFAEGRAEAQWIAVEIERLKEARGGSPYREIAVLVRATYLTRGLEEQFRWNSVPYEVIGGPGFYQRAEIRDAVAYLQCVHNPTAMVHFLRIANTPRRGLGPAALQAVREAYPSHGTFAGAARQAIERGLVKGRGGKQMAKLLEQIESWRSAAEMLPLRDLAALVLKESGYQEFWAKSIGPDAPVRQENLREFVEAMGSYSSLEAFIEEVELQAAAEADESEDRVRIMTIHAAKGLEFDAVFLPGWEDQVIPSPRALEDTEGKALEEERRLAHVAITRARKHLAITHAQMRFQFGQTQYQTPSRFLREIPAKHTKQIEDTGSKLPAHPVGSELELRAARARPYNSPGWRRMQRQAHLASSGVATRRMVAAAPRPAHRAAREFKEGERVFNQRFGIGEVASCDGSRVEVEFNDGRKTVMANYLKPANED